MKEKISVCIPVYNGADTILQTIRSIQVQTFKDFELVIVDNASTDNTIDVVKSVVDDRIKLYRNESNLGAERNLEECMNRAKGDILFYICADDILDIYTLEKVYNAFITSDDIGIVTRPYFWFDNDVMRPIRITKQFQKDHIVSIEDSYDKIADVIALSDQISGIGFRRKYMIFSFRQEPFVAMAGMVVPMLKICKAMILKDNIVGVRTSTSGSMNYCVYKTSPMLSWFNLIITTYNEDKYIGLRKYLINNFVANNYVGLIQIRNFGDYNYLFREIYYLIKLRWKNIFDIRFWFFSIGTISIPRCLLKRLVILYKKNINSKLIKNIKFNCGFLEITENTNY